MSNYFAARLEASLDPRKLIGIHLPSPSMRQRESFETLFGALSTDVLNEVWGPHLLWPVWPEALWPEAR